MRALAGLDAQPPLSRARDLAAGTSRRPRSRRRRLPRRPHAAARSRSRGRAAASRRSSSTSRSVADPARRDDHVAEVAGRVVSALAGADVLLFTSRTLARGAGPRRQPRDRARRVHRRGRRRPRRARRAARVGRRQGRHHVPRRGRARRSGSAGRRCSASCCPASSRSSGRSRRPAEVVGVPVRGVRGQRRRRDHARLRRRPLPGGRLMLAHGPQILLDARAEGRAVPAFTTYTLESTRAICEAAERTGLPVILSAGSSSFRGSSRAMLAAAAVAAAREASVPVGVHLDHSTDLDGDPRLPRARLHVGDARRIAAAVRGERGAHAHGRRRGARGRRVGGSRARRGGGRRGRVHGRASPASSPTPSWPPSSSRAPASTRSPRRSGPSTASRPRRSTWTSTACARSRRATGVPFVLHGASGLARRRARGGGRRRRGEGEHQRGAAGGHTSPRSTGTTVTTSPGSRPGWSRPMAGSPPRSWRSCPAEAQRP